MTVHAVAQWLEEIYEPHLLNELGNRPASQQRDFSDMSDVDKLYEFKALAQVVDLLRCGQYKEAQQKLQLTQNNQLYLWLVGAQPLFDNFRSAQQYIQEKDSLLLQDQTVERVEHLAKVTSPMLDDTEYEDSESIVYGNRMNLLFIDTALQKIAHSQKDSKLDILEDGILGLMVGEFNPVKLMIEKGGINTDLTFHDHLWALFRVRANRQLISDQIEQSMALQENEFDQIYSDEFLLAVTEMEQDPMQNYKNLLDKYKQLPTVHEQYKKEFKREEAVRTWHDTFQFKLILAYLGELHFDDVVIWLKESTLSENITDDETIQRIEFSANYLILLKIQGRLSEEVFGQYNQILSRYCSLIGNGLLQNYDQNNEYLSITCMDSKIFSLYVGLGIVGQNQQLDCLAYILSNVKDDNLQLQFLRNNQEIWRPEFLSLVYQFLVLQSFYGAKSDDQRTKYLQSIKNNSADLQEVS